MLPTCRSPLSRARLWVPLLILAGASLSLPVGGPPPLAAPGAPAEPDVLAWVTPDQTGDLLARNAILLSRLGQLDLVEVEPRVLEELGIGRVADPTPWVESTYLVTGPPETLESLSDAVYTSRGPGDWWLVRGPHDAVEELGRRGMSLVALEPSPARPLPVPSEARGFESLQSSSFNPDVALLVMQLDPTALTGTLQRLQDFVTRYSYTDSCAAAADYLYDRFAQMGLSPEYDPFLVNGHPVNNVIGTQIGTTRPDEIYIICGHYDSTSEIPEIAAPGADDNGSGATAVVEVAELFSKFHFESTIRYICFGGEEQGLVGSRHYVENVVVPQMLDVRGVINMDMVAYVHPDYPDWDANIYADDQYSLDLGMHVAQCLRDYTTCTDVLIPTSGPQWGSDHYWFAEYGYPAAFGIDAQLWGAPDWNPHYHSTNDVIDTLDLFYLTDFTRGAAAAIAELAVLVTGTGIADAGAPTTITPVRVSPNPFAERVVFDAGSEALTVTIADVTGRVVTRLTGSAPLVWEGRDAAGRRLPSGVYFYSVAGSLPGGEGRLLVIR